MTRSVPLVLVADDDKDFRDVITAKLKSRGFLTKTAPDGEEAVKIAKEILPDLVLMDVQMPNKDGVAATLDLQQDPHTKNIKVLFISNLGDSWPAITEVNRRLARQIGAVDYFRKGGDLDLLIAKVHEKLAQ